MPIYRRNVEQRNPVPGLLPSGLPGDGSGASSPSVSPSDNNAGGSQPSVTPSVPADNNPPPPSSTPDPPKPSSKTPKPTPSSKAPNPESTPSDSQSKSVSSDDTQQSSSSAAGSQSSTPTLSKSSTAASAKKTNALKATANSIVGNGGLGQVTGSYTPTISGADGIASASSTPTATGSLNTGAIVGGIAGGLVALALLGFLISFIIRRFRERAREEEFDASQNRRSVMTFGGFGGGNDARPLSIFGRRWGGANTPSIHENMDGNNNLAGRGVNHYQTEAYATTMQQTSAAAPASHGLQQRPQYTFGQAAEDPVQVEDHGGDDVMEEADGAYSAAPQMQNVYNLEAYGDYHAHGTYSPSASAHESHMTGGDGGAMGAAHEDDAYGGI